MSSSLSHGGCPGCEDATTTIPIVMFDNLEPVAAGFVASLARPGGNLTGILIAPDARWAKSWSCSRRRFREPRIAFLVPTIPLPASGPGGAEGAASLGVELLVVEVRAVITSAPLPRWWPSGQGSLCRREHLFFPRSQADHPVGSKHRLPAIYEWPDQVRTAA